MQTQNQFEYVKFQALDQCLTDYTQRRNELVKNNDEMKNSFGKFIKVPIEGILVYKFIINNTQNSQKMRFGIISQLLGKYQFRVGFYGETKQIFTDGLDCAGNQDVNTADIHDGDIFEFHLQQSGTNNCISFFLNRSFLGKQYFPLNLQLDYFPFVGLEVRGQSISSSDGLTKSASVPVLQQQLEDANSRIEQLEQEAKAKDMFLLKMLVNSIHHQEESAQNTCVAKKMIEEYLQATGREIDQSQGSSQQASDMYYILSNDFRKYVGTMQEYNSFMIKAKQERDLDKFQRKIDLFKQDVKDLQSDFRPSTAVKRG